MRITVIAVLWAFIFPSNPSAATVIECRYADNDKHFMIDGLDVTRVVVPEQYRGWFTFNLDNRRGVKLTATSGDFEKEFEIVSKQQFIFNGKEFFGHGNFELDGQKFEMRSILSTDRFLYSVSNHRGQTNKVLTGEVSCLALVHE